MVVFLFWSRLVLQFQSKFFNFITFVYFFLFAVEGNLEYKNFKLFPVLIFQLLKQFENLHHVTFTIKFYNL